MELKRLNSDVVTQIRSSSNFGNVSQCVLELVLNSLDANATAIAIRVNLVTLRIQVVDNGEGISRKNMDLIGLRYFTNKFFNLEELDNKFKHYGFKGESLANLMELSKSVNVTSKYLASAETYCVDLGANGKVRVAKERPSTGTTVTVEGLFHKLPVRQKRIVKELELDDIKKCIRSIIIIHPKVTFSLRDDVSNELVLSSSQHDDIPSVFHSLHPESKEGAVIKISKGKLSVNALLFKNYSESNKLQYLYVNKRPIYSSKIQKLMVKLLNKNSTLQKKSETKKLFPIYVINIKCPFSEVGIILNANKTIADFKNWDRVEKCIRKLVDCFFGKSQTPEKTKSTEKEKISHDLKPNRGMSRIQGVVKAHGYKRKNKNASSNSKQKLKKCIDKEKDISHSKENIEKICNNTCDIIDSTCKEQIKKQWKEPLPVDILPKEKKVTSKQLLCLQDTKTFMDKSQSEMYTLSRFTNDENKGKNLILNMFLKSTQVYQSDENIHESSKDSEDTVYEEESNLLVENNIKTNVNGKKRTMSMSINMKRSKKIKRRKNIVSEKCIQTTLENNMISKQLQTTFKEKSKFRGDDITLADNFTLVFTNDKKRFKFVPTKPETSGKLDFLYKQNSNCGCCCHNDKMFNFEKFFNVNLENYNQIKNFDNRANNFHKIKKICRKQKNKISKTYYPSHLLTKKNIFQSHINENYSNSILNRNIQTEPSPNNFNLNKIKAKADFDKNLIFMPHFVSGINKKYINQHQQIYEQSPYFRLKKPVNIDQQGPNCCYNFGNNRQLLPLNFQSCNNYLSMDQNILDSFSNPNLGPFNQFKPLSNSTQYNQLLERNYYTDKVNNVMDFASPYFQPQELITNKKNNDFRLENVDTCWNMTIKSFDNFNPIYQSTQKKQKFDMLQQKFMDSKNDEEGYKMYSLSGEKTYNKETFCGQNPDPKPPNNVIISSENEKQNLIEEELGAEKSLLMKEFLEWNSQFTQEENKVEKDNCDWTKRYDIGHSFYINKKTGYASYIPRELKNPFGFGMIPVLKKMKLVDQSLSPNGKNALTEYILETHKQDLLFVKWQHYLKDIDANTFFENVYKEKQKMYESSVPTINTALKNNDTLNFNKKLFENLDVIGQLDRKFIVAREQKENVLLLFDQHAVHERIRLENLMKIYKNAKSVCQEKLMYFLPQNELSLLKRYEAYLNYIGLSIEYFSNGIYVTKVPFCLYSKFNEENSHGTDVFVAGESIDVDVSLEDMLDLACYFKVTTKSLNEMVNILINEIIEMLKTTRGVSLKVLPKLVQNIINLEACRGAVKFGDNLNGQQCSELLEKLSKTDLPFQCAHGRPTLTPLLRLSSDSFNKFVHPRVNFKNLKKN